MKTILNVKTDKEVKIRAQKIASEIGVPLSTVVNSFLRQFIRDGKVTFSTYEKPSAYLEHIIKDAQNDLASGAVFGPFDSVDALMSNLRVRK